VRDHAAAPEPSPRSGRRPQLNEVLFGSNPTPASRWTQITGTQADIATVGYARTATGASAATRSASVPAHLEWARIPPGSLRHLYPEPLRPAEDGPTGSP
jgi:hypothetical protein